MVASDSTLPLISSEPALPPASPPRRPSLFRNVLLNIGGRGTLVLLSLLTTPLLVHHLGTAAYGVYILATTLGGVLSLLDFGLTPAVITLVSRAWHQQDHVEIQRIVSTAFTLYLGIGLAGAAILTPVVPWLCSDVLHVPAPLLTASYVALWLSIAGFVLNMWFAVFNAIPSALERFDLITARMVGLSLATVLALIAAALLGGGVPTLVTVNVLGTGVGLLLFYLASRTLLPMLHFRPGFHAASFHALARFSAFKFAGTIGGLLTFRFDQFAIAGLLGVNAVSTYAIPANGASRVFSLITELMTPVYPRASKLKNDPAASRNLLLTGTRLLLVASGPALVLLFVFADHVLLYWIGGQQGQALSGEGAGVMRWLLASYLIQTTAGVATIICEAFGHPEINNGFSVAGALIHIPLVLALVPLLGPSGAALALFLNSATQTVAFVVYASRRMAAVGPGELLRLAVARPLAAIALSGLVGYLLRPLAHDVVSLILVMLPVLLVYVLATIISRAITVGDLQYIKRVVTRLPVWIPGRAGLIRRTSSPSIAGPDRN